MCTCVPLPLLPKLANVSDYKSNGMSYEQNIMIGEQIEHYRIDAVQGRGGLGTVYRAYDTNLIRPVALKLILPQFAQDPTYHTHIMQEAKAAARLIHPNIATIYNFNSHNKQLYLVSEFINGFSLAQLLAQLSTQQQVLRLSESLLLMAEVAEAISYAHQQGVLHRNLKPSNIILKPMEGKRVGQLPIRPLITDFGLTRHLGGDVKSSAVTLGADLNYMSPEQCIGNRLDGRSDIYNMGLLLYELISGQRPFQIYSPTEAMIMHALETPPPLGQIIPNLPPEIEQIVNIATAKAPEKRFQDMRQLAEQLRQAANRHADFEQPNAVSLTSLLEGVLKLDTAVAETKQNPVLNRASLGQLPIPEDELVEILQEALAGESDSAVESELSSQPNVTETPPLAQTIIPKSTQIDQVVVQRPGRSPIMVPLSKDKLMIGRSRDNDIVLETADVSRKHAQLEKTSAGWRIVDLNSTGGTYWGGHKLLPNVPEAWNSNQTLRIGPYSLRWLPARAPRPFRPSPPEEDEITQLHVVPTEGIQTSSTRGSFSLMVNPVLTALNPGEQKVVQVELFNQGSEADHFNLRIADLPPLVSSLSQNSVFLAVGERAVLPITLVMPEDNPMSAGHHPFQIIVRRALDSSDTAVISARIHVGHNDRFSIGVWPLDVTQNGICQILIRNEGNRDGRYSVVGSSTDQNVTFMGERGQIRIPPGEATTLSMAVGSETRPLFGRQQQIPFKINVRSETGQEQTETGQLGLQPLFPAWILPALEIFIVILFAGFVIANNLSTRNGGPAQALGQVQLTRPADELIPSSTIIPALATASLLDDDDDGLSNGDEQAFATDPTNPDTDEDGLLDGDEVGLYDTIPTAPDTDEDGLLDGEEVFTYATNPLFADTDLDGVNDGDEVNNGTDPLRFPTAAATPVLPDEEEDEGSGSTPPEPTAVPTELPTTEPTSLPATQPATQPTTAATAVPTNTPIPTAQPTDTPSESTTIQIPLLDDGTGWVSLNGQVSQGIANLVRAGDTSEGDTVRGFFTYDINQVPADAIVTDARLTFSNDATIEGNPFVDLDCLLIEAAEYDLPLDAEDYDSFAFYIDCEAGPPTVLDVLIDVQDALDFQLPYLQFRLAFNEDTNFDTQADQLVIRRAPVLEVTYELP